MKREYLILLALNLIAASVATASDKISLVPGANMTRADIYITRASGRSVGTLILCPGHNGNGDEMVREDAWAAFAQQENLDLVGLSFASEDNSQDEGYFKAESGSGALLIDGLKRALGPAPRPLFLYGFSRGAQFVDSFVRWKPDGVAAWCAYSATEWENPEANAQEPRGIIACGDEDEPNYSSAVFQFLRGRGMDKPWTWVSLARTGHSRSVALESLVRAYFASLLLNPGTNGLWLDVDTKNPLAPEELREHPTLASWLPDRSVAETWKNLHQP
jgi:predicted esterase